MVTSSLKSMFLLDLIASDKEGVFVVDADYQYKEDKHYFVRTDHAYSRSLFGREVSFVEIGKDIVKSEINGEFIGLFRLSGQTLEAFKNQLEKNGEITQLQNNSISYFLERFCKKQHAHCQIYQRFMVGHQHNCRFTKSWQLLG